MSQQTVPRDLQERDLVVAAQCGDKAAFRQLYELYRDRVYSLIRYSVSDASLAEDLLQTVFVNVYRALPGFRFEASFSTWIYRIAANACTNARQRRKAPFVPLEALLGSGDEIDSEIGPDERYALNQRQQILCQAVDELSPKLREAVVLRYVEGLSYDEIAAVLGCAPGTVASRLNRALSELESRLRLVRRLL